MHAITGLVTRRNPGCGRPGRMGVPEAMFWSILRTKEAWLMFFEEGL